jgi:FRG domain
MSQTAPPPVPEIRVESWAQLMQALHEPDLIPVREPYVFRGVDNAAWRLETSLQRLPRSADTPLRRLEEALIRNFRKYASAGSFDVQSEWYVLAVAQHNGLPTRCLDWTVAPLVAAHFACGDMAQKDQDGVIWCLNAEKLRGHNEAAANRIGGPLGWAKVYDTRILTNEYDSLETLDKDIVDAHLRDGRPDLKGEICPAHRLLLWEPPSLDARIASQAGLLSLVNDAEVSQDELLRASNMQTPNLVQCIVIAASAKPEIRDLLDQNGISERSLFPGLPGLCQWLKRYYSQAW